MRLKFRTYAIFQFLSFVALLSLTTTGMLVAYRVGGIEKSIDSIDKSLSDSFAFKRQEAIGIMSSIFMYVTLILWVFTWMIGGTILRIKNRNMYDSLFLLFIMIPFVSNMFALLAQMSLKTQDYTPSAIDKKAIIKETEKLVKAEMRNPHSIKDMDSHMEKLNKHAKKYVSQTTPAKKTPAKKATAKKPIAKKPVVKKTPAKKPTAKKPVVKKTTVKKATTTSKGKTKK